MSMVCWRRMFPHADVWRGSTPRECFRCQGLAVKVKRTSPRHTEEKTRFHQFAHSPPHSPPIQGRELGRATWPEFLSSIAALNTLVHKTSGNSSRFPHQLLTLPAHIRTAILWSCRTEPLRNYLKCCRAQCRASVAETETEGDWFIECQTTMWSLDPRGTAIPFTLNDQLV